MKAKKAKNEALGQVEMDFKILKTGIEVAEESIATCNKDRNV